MPDGRGKLVAALLAGAGPDADVDGATGEALEKLLTDGLDAARAAWDQLPPPGEELIRHLGTHLSPPCDFVAEVGLVRFGELALAYAAGSGDARAIAILEE